jgi:hypothetical protein
VCINARCMLSEFHNHPSCAAARDMQRRNEEAIRNPSGG